MNIDMKLNPLDVQRIWDRCRQMDGFTPRELEIFILGLQDGKDLKADEVQPVLTGLELALLDERGERVTQL